jgi:LysM repeat protein
LPAQTTLLIVPDLPAESNASGACGAGSLGYNCRIKGKEMSLRRMLPFLLLNILVSAAVVLLVLWWWDGRSAQVLPQATASQENSAALAVQPVEQAPGQAPLEPTTGASEQAGGPQVHVVQLGETLGIISVQYDVPVEDIMAANGLDNPNFLAVGQELVIPAEGVALPTAAVAAEPTTAALPSPIPTEPAGEGEAQISIAEVIGAGDIATEGVTIVNNGSGDARLEGWQLIDGSGNSYVFRQVTLFGSGAGISLHTRAGEDSATELFWGLTEPLWDSGDLAQLFDAEGGLRAELQIP